MQLYFLLDFIEKFLGLKVQVSMGAFIRSRHNERICFIDKLKKASKRKKFGIFPIEGSREITRAYQMGFVQELLFCEEFFSAPREEKAIIEQIIKDGIEVTSIASEVYQKISLREHGDGLLALGKERTLKLEDCVPSKNPLFLVTENIEKPSNFGAIVRTAESAGVDGIIVLDGSTEVYNPNAIRNSQGALFFAKIYQATTEAFLKFLQQYSIHLFVTTPHAENPYFLENYCKGSAILVGSESQGVSQYWLQQAHTIQIPQRGLSDSLNVSVATAIVLYECVRQRSMMPVPNQVIPQQ